MGGQRLRQQRSGRQREVVRHRDQLQLVVERAGDDLDHLPDRQHLLVRRVEHLAGRRIGVVEGQDQRVCEVLRVPVVVQGETVVGDDHPPPTVEHPPHDQPLARDQLVRPVDVRVPEVRGVGVMLNTISSVRAMR